MAASMIASIAAIPDGVAINPLVLNTAKVALITQAIKPLGAIARLSARDSML